MFPFSSCERNLIGLCQNILYIRQFELLFKLSETLSSCCYCKRYYMNIYYQYLYGFHRNNSLVQLLKLSAASVVLLAYGSCILDAVIIGTSSASWEMYLAAGTGILKGMPAPMCLAILSTFVTSSETGDFTTQS